MAGVDVTDKVTVYIDLPSVPVPSGLGNVIRALSPSKIEEEAMRRMEWGSEAGIVQNVLQVVAEVLDASL